MFRDMNNEIVKCRRKIMGHIFGCKWEGTIAECTAEWYSSSPEAWMSLAGREGWIYKCPKCGNIIREDWFKVS